MNNAIDLDNNGNFNWELDNVRYLNDLLFKLLNFIDSGDFVIDGHQFFNDGWHFNNSVLILNSRLSDSGLNFLDNFVDVRSDLFNFLYHFTNDCFLYGSIDLFDSNILYSHLNDSFDLLNDLDNFLDFSIDLNDNLNNSIYGNWHFDWHNSGLFNFDDSLNFNYLRDNSVNLDFSWDFNSGLNNPFSGLFNNLDNFDHLFKWYDLLHYSFNNSVNFSIDVVDLFNFHDSVLHNRYLDYLLDFSDSFNFNYSVNNLLDDLRNLHNLFNDSWYNDNLFN